MLRPDDSKITVIEGPPPVFEGVNDGWALALMESMKLKAAALTRLNVSNGPELVERCYRRWNHELPIELHYLDLKSVEHLVPIFAARNVETSTGHVLLLWLAFDYDKVVYESDKGNDGDGDGDDDGSGGDPTDYLW